MDLPKLTSDNETLEVFGNHSEPEFEQAFRYGLEMEIDYPISTGQFISADGRVFDGTVPGFSNGEGPVPWSLWIGYSISLDKITKSVGSIFPFGNNGD